MKNIFTIVLVVAAVTGLLRADQMQEKFLEGCALYEQQKVHKALDCFTAIPSPYPAVLYNTAVCQYALGNYTETLALCRKVQRSGSQDICQKARQLRLVVNEKLGLQENSVFEIAFWVSRYVSHPIFIFLFFAVLAFLSFCVWYFGATRKKLSAIFAVLVCCMGSLVVYGYWFRAQRYGIVIPKVSSVYAGPDKQYHTVAQLEGGQQVKVVQEDQSWYKVYFPEGKGWVEQADITLF